MSAFRHRPSYPRPLADLPQARRLVWKVARVSDTRLRFLQTRGLAVRPTVRSAQIVVRKVFDDMTVWRESPRPIGNHPIRYDLVRHHPVRRHLFGYHPNKFGPRTSIGGIAPVTTLCGAHSLKPSAAQKYCDLGPTVPDVGCSDPPTRHGGTSGGTSPRNVEACSGTPASRPDTPECRHQRPLAW